jgi:hypothetical protein
MITTYEELLESLVRAQIKFVLAGGLAVCLNGFVRTTNDHDILIDFSPENVSRLASCLAAFGQGFGATLTPEEVTDEPGAIRIRENFDLDIFTRLNGKSLTDLAPMVDLYLLPSGIHIPFLNAEGLIETKRGSGRQKDLADLGFLMDRQKRCNPGSSFRLASVRDEVSNSESLGKTSGS